MEEEYLDATIQMPQQASTLAPMLDSLYYDIFWISVVFFVAIVGCMCWFAYQFRRRPGVKSKPPGHHNALELFWTFSPLILLAYMFHEGFDGFMYMSVPPPSSHNVRVTASQWSWRFEYPNGGTDSELWVPENEPVRLIMGSEDVLHSFYVPALRVKRDVVPGMFSSIWFEPTRRGRHPIFCTEYCGASPDADDSTAEELRADGRPTSRAGHSGMLSRLHIVSRSEWNARMRELLVIPPEYNGDYARWGGDIFQSPQGGCTACHHIQDGPHGTGPNLNNVAGYEQPLEGGRTAMADLEYLRESLRQPGAAIVSGYAGGQQMPSQAGLGELKIDALVAYIASLSDRGDEIQEQVRAAHADD